MCVRSFDRMSVIASLFVFSSIVQAFLRLYSVSVCPHVYLYRTWVWTYISVCTNLCMRLVVYILNCMFSPPFVWLPPWQSYFLSPSVLIYFCPHIYVNLFICMSEYQSVYPCGHAGVDYDCVSLRFLYTSGINNICFIPRRSEDSSNVDIYRNLDVSRNRCHRQFQRGCKALELKTT